MTIRGQTRNISLGGPAAKNSDEIDTLVPSYLERRNGHFTEAGNWKRRPGYAPEWDLASSQAVNLLIPEEGGFATTGDGKVYELGEATGAELTGAALSGVYRPTYTMYQATATSEKMAVITDGGDPVKITFAPKETALLGGSPGKARFCDTLNTRLILAGYDDLSFKWSSLESPESFPAANFNSLKGDGEHLQFFKVWGRNAYFFKNKSLEIWTDTGTTNFLGRQAYVERGTASGYSVVFANNLPYWLGDDIDFYTLQGISPSIISTAYSKEIKKITDPSEVYGFHFEREKLIRWFAPAAHKCFVYDYITKTFSEDNQWGGGRWLRMPINSYMEKSNQAYFGDLDPTGKIYHWSHDYLDDDGEPIRLYRRFAVTMTENGGDARANRLRLRMDRGNGTVAEPAPKELLRWSFDKGPFASEDVDMGAVGEHDPYVDVTNLGIGREIEIEEVQSPAVESLTTHMFLTVEPLGH